MKNIHLLPTPKKSRLYLEDGIYKLDNLVFGSGNQNIYITNSEEIKEGDWCYHPLLKGGSVIQSKFNNPNSTMKKIILTTDQNLIKDGVQAIDDEFLEWFVKNPSCESVEVEIESKFDRVDGHYHDVWEIIIPKEELMNDVNSQSWGFENFEVIKTEEDAKIFVETMENIPEPNDKLKKAFRDFNKQETLEDASKKYALNRKFNMTSHLIGFRKGAKWQAERMYSEEELKEAFYNGWLLSSSGASFRNAIKKWFEQFKKK